MTRGTTPGSDAVSGPATISPRGDLDLASGSSLVSAVEATLQDGDTDAVVIDLAGVGFIDSSGLRALLDSRDRCEAAGCPLVLANLGPTVDRLLEIVALRGRFDIVGRIDDPNADS